MILPPRPRRSTASCFGTTTSCRHGASTSCAPRAGIGSAIPIRCRNTAHPNSRGCGGGTPTKRPRLEVPRPSFSKLESYQATWAGFVGPGVDGGMAIDVLDAGYDALLEFVR